MSVERLLESQTAARAQVRSKIAKAVAQQWSGLGSWNDADVERFTARVLPLVRAGQIQTAAMTDVYLAGVLSDLTGKRVRPLGLAREDVTDLRPVDAEEVYRRPFVEVWSGLKQGQEFTSALSVGADRLARLVDDDLSLAHRTAASAVFTDSAYVESYRRVIRPELSTTGTCPVCASAAEQTYRSEDLLPVHSRCGCDVLPVIGEGSGDPGARLNDEDLSPTTERADIVTRDHGELGPVLALAGQTFTTA